MRWKKKMPLGNGEQKITVSQPRGLSARGSSAKQLRNLWSHIIHVFSQTWKLKQTHAHLFKIFFWMKVYRWVNCSSKSRETALPKTIKTAAAERRHHFTAVDVDWPLRHMHRRTRSRSRGALASNPALRIRGFFFDLELGRARTARRRPYLAQCTWNVGKYQNGTSYTRVSARHKSTRLVLFGTHWLKAAGLGSMGGLALGIDLFHCECRNLEV